MPNDGIPRGAPVAGHERVFTLDALRGFAILGVLVANVFTVAYPSWLPAAAADLPEGGEAVRFAVGALVEGKFYVLFALLFGMGLGLQNARAAAAARAFAGVFRRRLGVLFVFGLLHGVLLYSGDILAFYAVLGWIALRLRRLSPRTLLAVAIGLFVAGTAAYGVYALSHPDAPMPGPPDWRQLADERRAATSTEDFRLAFFELMADEPRIFRSGTWAEQTRHRAAAYFLAGWPWRLGFISWMVLAYFVLGMYLVRREVFLDRGPAHGFDAWWTVGAFLGGMVLQGLALGMQQMGAALFALSLPALFAGALAVSFSYAGALAGLCRTAWGRAVLRPVAAVGRMALTNYLAGSIVFGLIFYGTLFGRVPAAQVLLVALALYLAELCWSPLWLRFFRFGPFEWLWRTITYRHLQPMRRQGRR